jgi:hypothetical protein
MTLKWVAERLAMGSWSNVSNLLAATRKKTGKKNRQDAKVQKVRTDPFATLQTAPGHGHVRIGRR